MWLRIALLVLALVLLVVLSIGGAAPLAVEPLV